jgi:hypothetical protein
VLLKQLQIELIKMVQQSILQIFSQGLAQHMAADLLDIVMEIIFLILSQPYLMARFPIELVVFSLTYLQIHICFFFSKFYPSGGVPNRFAMAMTSHTRPHHSTLPPPRLSWKMLPHPEKHGFLAAAQVKYHGLIKKSTWTTEDKDVITARPLPLKWVFVYKFNNDVFLEKHKAQIVVCDNLQFNILDKTDIYAHTPAI